MCIIFLWWVIYVLLCYVLVYTECIGITLSCNSLASSNNLYFWSPLNAFFFCILAGRGVSSKRTHLIYAAHTREYIGLRFYLNVCFMVIKQSVLVIQLFIVRLWSLDLFYGQIIFWFCEWPNLVSGNSWSRLWVAIYIYRPGVFLKVLSFYKLRIFIYLYI